MSDIYRGFEIEQNPDGTFWVWDRNGENYHVPSHEQALDLVDQIKRQEREAANGRK